MTSRFLLKERFVTPRLNSSATEYRAYPLEEYFVICMRRQIGDEGRIDWDFLSDVEIQAVVMYERHSASLELWLARQEEHRLSVHGDSALDDRHEERVGDYSHDDTCRARRANDAFSNEVRADVSQVAL